MGLDVSTLLRAVVASLIYATLGVVLFAVAFWIIAKSLPFSVRKEIEDDQNVALAVLLGAVILGIAIIIASVVRG